MTEFRVAWVRAGYHTGESLNIKHEEGSWSVELRASAHLPAGPLRPWRTSVRTFAHLAVEQEEQRDKAKDVPRKTSVTDPFL